MDTLVHTLAPGKDDVVVMDEWFGRRAFKGEDMATPVKSFRRTLQKHRRLAIMGEFNTSCKCAACGPDRGDACEKVIHPIRQRTLSRKAWDKSVQKTQAKLARDLTSNEKKELQFVDRKINGLSIFPHCKRSWSRDVNACCNFSHGFYYTCVHDARPTYLQRNPKRRLVGVLIWVFGRATAPRNLGSRTRKILDIQLGTFKRCGLP
jgi:hypothetical protein